MANSAKKLASTRRWLGSRLSQRVMFPIKSLECIIYNSTMGNISYLKTDYACSIYVVLSFIISKHKITMKILSKYLPQSNNMRYTTRN